MKLETNILFLYLLLKEAFLLPENKKYIRRATEIIIEYLYECFHSSISYSGKCIVAKCLGKFGHALQYDCKRYMKYI